jgi:hypothetical protein
MLGVGIRSSLCSPKLIRVVQLCSNLVIMLAREDDVHIHALLTMTEQFQLCEWGRYDLGKLHLCSECT